MALPPSSLRRVLAIIAGVFGVATLFAGVRVLLGADPGYVVYLPLLAFNTAMGAAYLSTGVRGWFDARKGRRGAATILVLNALMLAFIVWLYLAQPGTVARESVAAMGFRTAAWLVLWGGFSWAARRA
ncbi:hypothetical protein [Ramlibacter sp.]|uniref:hypothetical protein n=1 Tax=Ramlibacter sp. TaxID=1917967 RepID=UPI002D480507|nr:hypothetical protein [Ramlibacter sp.]HYD77702.1 hypothetical protein [Ramlibacter sp.]